MPLSRTRSAESAAVPDAPAISPVLTLLTDYGPGSLYVGQVHGVIARIAPRVRVIDVAHDIAHGDVLGGALALADALPFLPAGVHVAVVDPGVGSSRRALALRCRDGRVLVGPDNGLLSLAARACGGIEAAVEISDSNFTLDPVSSTFHGRDVFAPVAAALADGRRFSGAGVPLEVPDDLVGLELPLAGVSDGGLEAVITAVDGFGNLALFAGPRDLEGIGLALDDVVAVGAGERQRFARYGITFADVGAGRLLLHEDSTGRLALAVNGASAAALLEVRRGDRVRFSRRA